MKTKKEFLEIMHDNHLSDLVSDEVALEMLEKMDKQEIIKLILPGKFGMMEENKITVEQRIAAVKKSIETNKLALEIIEKKLSEEK